MSEDAIEKRKEKLKPTKLFSIVAAVWDDGVISGVMAEYVQFGREKGQKVVYTGEDAGKDFLSAVRSVVPSARESVETLVNQIEKDAEHEDTAESSKIGKVTINIYSDSYVETDFCELVQGSRGAPKAWRMHPSEFINAMGALAGNVSESFEALPTGAYTGQADVIDVVVENEE